MVSARKKHKAYKSKGIIPLLLTDGDINEIREKVQEVTTETWNKVDGHYRMLLTDIQLGIAKLTVLA